MAFAVLATDHFMFDEVVHYFTPDRQDAEWTAFTPDNATVFNEDGEIVYTSNFPRPPHEP